MPNFSNKNIENLIKRNLIFFYSKKNTIFLFKRVGKKWRSHIIIDSHLK